MESSAGQLRAPVFGAADVGGVATAGFGSSAAAPGFDDDDDGDSAWHSGHCGDCGQSLLFVALDFAVAGCGLVSSAVVVASLMAAGGVRFAELLCQV